MKQFLVKAGLLVVIAAGLFGLYAMYQTMVVPEMSGMTDSLKSHRDMSQTANGRESVDR